MDDEPDVPEPARRRRARAPFVARSVVVLALVLGGAAAAYTGATRLVGREDMAASEVNVAGRQRMLAQRIGLVVRLIVQDDASRSEWVAELNRALSLIERSHVALRDGGVVPDLDPGHPGVRVSRAPRRVREVLFGEPHRLDGLMRSFIATARSVSERTGRVSPDDPGLEALTQEVEGPVLAALDAAVHGYERELGTSERRSHLLIGGAVGASMLILAAGLSLGARRRRRLETDMEVEAARRESEAWFRAAVEGSFDALSIQRARRDKKGMIIDFEYVEVNERFALRLGRPRDKIIGRGMLEMLSPDVGPGVVARYARVVERAERSEEEVRLSLPGGERRWYQVLVVPVEDGVAVTARDVTEHKQRESELSYRAHHDALTGLSNRSALLERLDYVLSATADPSFAVLFIDLDGFKGVNDTLGHAAGDELLREVAERLRTTARSGDTVARFGGDEFVLLCERVRSDETAREVAGRVIGALGEPFRLERGEATIGASIGVAMAAAGCTATSLLNRADSAVYTAKGRGGSCVAIAAQADSGRRGARDVSVSSRSNG